MAKTRDEYSENLENQYRRLERTYNEIINNFEGKSFSKSAEQRLDPIYDFFLACYHLREWIKKDNKVDQTIKDRLPTFEGESSPVHFQMCRDLCNKSKHAGLEEGYKPNDVNTKIVTYGGAIFQVSKKEMDEAHKKKETIHLKDEDGIFLGNYYVEFKGKKYDLKGVVQACMHVWKDFFEKNDLLLPRSTPYAAG
ncbi:hypothetical protein AMJ49_02095 [Parcubacteria bacterium DG_74_2]|nr:MAG: hypothetical protein AMJ49_02095 [Parcubacteria bacterium DG_74_2]